MSTIDYAFLADFAKVEPNGTLTVVGASFNFLTVPMVPVNYRLAVAGRVRSRKDDGTIPLRISFSGPNETYNINTDGELTPAEDALTYGDGLLGHLFALDMQLPIPVVGTYTVDVTLPASGASRRLAFEVRLNDLG